VVDDPHLDYLAGARRSSIPFAEVGRAVPTPLIFHYRQSPAQLRPLDVAGAVTVDDPAPLVPREASLDLDSLGRLTFLRVLPPASDRVGPFAAEPDWTLLISAVGLRGIALQTAAPARVPPVAADTRRAWTATLDGEPVRLEAAAYDGHIVFAERQGPWHERRADSPAEGSGFADQPTQTLLALMWMGTLIAVGLLARRNLRMGRGDRRGAQRVAAFVLAIGIFDSIIGRHWVVDAPWLWGVISTRQGTALFNAALVWLFYLGLEPFARRHWPQLLIGWTRLLEGRWRDPLVGQGLLAGVLLGTLLPIVATLPELSGRFFGLAGAQPSFWASSLAPPAIYLSAVGSMALIGLKNSLGLVAFMVVVRFALRAESAVFVATALVATTAAWSGVAPPALDLVQAAIAGVATVLFFRRFGLLALVAGLAVNYVVRQTPWTLDYARWFAWRPGLTCALVAGLMVWGFVSVLGRQSAFAAPDLDA
jgi:hypothetical protein